MSKLVLIQEDDLRRLVSDAVRDALAEAPPTATVDDRAIVAERIYTPDEAARLLGFGTPERPRTKSVYEIPETDLPKLRIGAARGSVRYLGADLLAYAKGLPPRDTAAELDAARQRLTDRLSRPGNVAGTVGQPGRRRIL